MPGSQKTGEPESHRGARGDGAGVATGEHVGQREGKVGQGGRGCKGGFMKGAWKGPMGARREKGKAMWVGQGSGSGGAGGVHWASGAGGQSAKQSECQRAEGQGTHGIRIARFIFRSSKCGRSGESARGLQEGSQGRSLATVRVWCCKRAKTNSSNTHVQYIQQNHAKPSMTQLSGAYDQQEISNSWRAWNVVS